MDSPLASLSGAGTKELSLLLAACLLSVWIVKSRKQRSAYPLPPSPPGELPLLGHALKIPTRYEWETYEQWAKELNSDMFYLNAAGLKLLIVNSVDKAKDLLDSRSAKYSSRSSFPMVNELMGYDWTMPTLPYNNQWKDQRKMFVRFFHRNNEPTFLPRITQFVRRMLPRLLEKPEDFMNHAKLAVGGIAFSLAYGIHIQADDDPNIKIADDALDSVLDQLLPGKNMVDVMPFLKYVPEWFPGATRFQRDARLGRQVMTRMYTAPWEQALREINAGTVLPSLTSTILDDVREGKTEDPEKTKKTLQELAATLYGAGSDTGTATINNFFLAMILYPDAQAKIRKEIDSIIGTDRLPEFEDESDLPYLSAALKELIRWRPVSNLGLPHQCTEDDVYQGYFIPKGTLVMPNQRTMLHNPEDYPEPEKFIPERFLTADGKPNPNVRDPYEVAFGFGRRICPGFRLSIATTFMAAATVISLFELSKAKDKNGNPIEPSLDISTGITSHPLPFQCVFKLRSAKAEELIRNFSDYDI